MCSEAFITRIQQIAHAWFQRTQQSYCNRRSGSRWGYPFPFTGDAQFVPPSSTAEEHRYNHTRHCKEERESRKNLPLQELKECPNREEKNLESLQSKGNYVFRQQSTSVFPDITGPKQTVRNDHAKGCDFKGKRSSGPVTGQGGERQGNGTLLGMQSKMQEKFLIIAEFVPMTWLGILSVWQRNSGVLGFLLALSCGI